MKVTFDISKKRIAYALALIIIVALPTFVIASNMGYRTGYSIGFKEGYVKALTDIEDQTDLRFEWTDLGDGRYEVKVYQAAGVLPYAKGHVEIHIWVQKNAEAPEHHAGVLTTIGKDWIEDQLGDSPGTDPAKWISCSNDASSPSAAWTQIPNEINANGFSRAVGTYASTGTGTWNITKTFTATGTQSVQLYGLQWVSTPVSDNNLLCSDTSSQKNCGSGDTLKVTWQVSVT